MPEVEVAPSWLEEELNCRLCQHFLPSECKKGRRLRLRDDNHWWPLGSSGLPQPPRYCSMREGLKDGSN